MIETFDIQGFKSVKNIHLDCRRINLFIGEPNTGKSNILEALGFLSWCAHGGDLRDYVRLDKAQDLFYDGLVEKDSWKLTITTDSDVAEKGVFDQLTAGRGKGIATPTKAITKRTVSANYQGGQYQISSSAGVFANLHPQLHPQGRYDQVSPQKGLDFVQFYRFKRLPQATVSQLGPLLTPDGQNIVALLFSSRALRQLAADFFSPYKLTLVIKPHDGKLEVQKTSEGIAVSFPYHLTSDTLQRMVFYTIAIESNKESTLVFEEPEAHAFPYFTKYLGERIALDENKNQYFIATHNPYLLSAIVEKAPAADVAVFATYYRDYETHVKLLDQAALSRLFEADPFLGIDQFIGDKT